MKIYPPFTKWTTVIKDPLAFQQFLKENVDTCSNTGRYIKYKGDLSQDGFRIERNLSIGNSNRPKICGKIEQTASGEQELSITIESRKTLLYIVLVFSVLIGLIGIIQQKPFALVAILIVTAWMWFVGFILHLIEIKQTKVEVDKIIEIAQASMKAK